jgi:hypothetical protein
MTSVLNKDMPQLIAWIVVVPVLAVWPFLSAFPVFTLIGSSSLSLSTWLNVGFSLTGFWSLAGGFWFMRWLTDCCFSRRTEPGFPSRSEPPLIMDFGSG